MMTQTVTLLTCIWEVSLMPTILKDVGFEVFTAVVLKNIFFWDMTPCSALSGALPLACSLLR
jgi:hypothetical protein